MKTEYINELTPTQLKKELSQLGVELTDDQYRTLLRCGRTFLYAARERRNINSNIFYRMSYPLFFVWNLFITLIVQPLKWLFTGIEYFSMDNPIYKFTIKWRRKIGF